VATIIKLICAHISSLEISRALLVYDVKISQLGSKNLIYNSTKSKNLTVRFDSDQIGRGDTRCPLVMC